MNQRPANRFGGCTHPPVERHSVAVPLPGSTFEVRRTLRPGGWPRDSRSHQAWGCVVAMGTGGLGIPRAAAAST